VKIKGLGGVKPEKIFKKSIDKCPKVCYNKDIEREVIKMMYVVEIYFDGEWYPYCEFDDRDLANEVAMEVRDERGCWVRVTEKD
jgi:hypothetical protein